MTDNMKRDQILSTAVRILKEYGAKKIVLFGSYARGTEKKNSDIDLIVRFKATKSLLELVKIEREVSKATKKQVDLLTEKAISPYIRDSMKKELEVLYS